MIVPIVMWIRRRRAHGTADPARLSPASPPRRAQQGRRARQWHPGKAAALQGAGQIGLGGRAGGTQAHPGLASCGRRDLPAGARDPREGRDGHGPRRAAMRRGLDGGPVLRAPDASARARAAAYGRAQCNAIRAARRAGAGVGARHAPAVGALLVGRLRRDPYRHLRERCSLGGHARDRRVPQESGPAAALARPLAPPALRARPRRGCPCRSHARSSSNPRLSRSRP